MSDYYDKGWEQFPFDINLYNWAIRGRQIASEKIHLLKEYKKELRCGGTWFPGVNFLSNDLYGNIKKNDLEKFSVPVSTIFL